MQRLIDAACQYGESLRVPLEEALRDSNRNFAPLCDPLNDKLGTHRWLKSAREEVYSDWLAWIFETITDAADIRSILNLEASDAPSLSQPKVARELFVWIPKKDAEQLACATTRQRGTGRLDLDIDVGDGSWMLIEVKLDHPDEVKGLNCQIVGYKNARDSSGRGFKQHIKLVIAAGEPGNLSKYDSDYHFSSWATVCQGIRRVVRRRLADGSRTYMQLALALSFAGAVERNLLKLATPGKAHQPLQYAQTLRHIQRSERSNA
ncbi:hypothetical protein [Silvibacterium dinghuense]|uniref:Uncharacterized protein n=1 Tax=Silvibacterium dinghuense TaxID=1560006 RepID=A0A4Q1SI05_9BACT|nr:hypothetical protein [Silvibacterium dinghuense]RXS96999.1 hypothetical protein ESZ00_03430 [Silvibacterium dinghuense]GGG95356.1 hypothetical protein GCM10011586_07980 [Silvibacterium dinghuense]